MRLARVMKLRMRSLLRRGRVEEHMERELEMHLEVLTAELMAEGMDEGAARAEARRQFGSLDAVKEECRDMRRVNYIEDLVRDCVCAWRGLRRAPGFAITAVVSLALGIGANTVVFSTLHALLLRPAPVRAPERLQFINDSGRSNLSFPAYRDVRDRNRSFESLFASRIVQVAVGQPGGARRVWALVVTGNYFEALGVQPAMGRFFTPEEDRRVNESAYAVLSYDCWQSRFGGDPMIAGKEVRSNGKPYQVLGVTPRGFHSGSRSPPSIRTAHSAARCFGSP